jgi:hypothetical protein
MKKLIIACLLFILTAACAPPVVTEYKVVEVPVVCNVDMPQRPILSDNIVLKVVDLIEYVQLLETAFKACKGEI